MPTQTISGMPVVSLKSTRRPSEATLTETNPSEQLKNTLLEGLYPAFVSRAQHSARRLEDFQEALVKTR